MSQNSNLNNPFNPSNVVNNINQTKYYNEGTEKINSSISVKFINNNEIFPPRLNFTEDILNLKNEIKNLDSSLALFDFPLFSDILLSIIS